MMLSKRTNMKHFLRSLSILAISCSAATAMAGEDDLPDEDAPAVAPPAAVPPPVATVTGIDPEIIEELEERLRETEDLLDEVETRSLLQKLKWSGDYRTIVTHGKYSGPSPDGARDPVTGAPVAVDLTNDEQWLHRLRLNLEAQPYKDLRFTGRLTMFKRYGTNTATLFAQDSSETRIPRDNTLRLERAWIDWFISEHVALSMGRISYSNGSPGELKENQSESDASWGLHMVDGEYETVNLTFTPTENLLARAFYISWAFPQENDINSFFLPLNNGVKNLRIIGGNVDFRPKENALVQLGAYAVPKFRPFTVPIPNPNPPPNPANAPVPFDGSLIFPSKKSPTLGTYANLSALVLMKDIAGSGLDLFASAAIGFLKPEPGAAISYNLPSPAGGLAEFPLLGLASAEKCWDEDPMVGLVPKGECDVTTSYFGYVGARYTLPMKSKRAPKLGFEYNFASQYWISFNTPTTDLTNKLANRGNSFEGYVIFPFNDKLFARLHTLVIQTDYSGGFFGPIPNSFGGTAPATDSNLTIFGAMLNATF